MKHKTSYTKLQQHFEQISKTTLKELFQNDNNRADGLNLSHEDLFFDFSKNNITKETISLLIDLANESDLPNQIINMFSGKKINNTENRAVLHTALRNKDRQIIVDGDDVSVAINNVLERMKSFTNRVRTQQHKGYTNKPITDVVNIGIGGSDLGPVLACNALEPYASKDITMHFISSVDGYQIKTALSKLNPETTLFIIASKTFTTQETMTNAYTAREWFLSHAKNPDYLKYHFVATSTNTQKVQEFGIDPNNMFEFWDFVGGRYSMFSAIGLSTMLYIGYDNFRQMLDGALSMDMHFFNTKDLSQNIPVILGLIGIWYINFYNYHTLIISPYNTRLTKLPAYIQQLEMESNGKSVNRLGESLSYKTCPVIWGDHGINGQHAYYQLLHQGTSINPMDIIVALSSNFTLPNHNHILIANAFAQSEAFMNGKTYIEVKTELINAGTPESEASFLAKHKVFTGNRPTNTITVKDLSPYYFGMLIALYEHKTFVQGVIWDINSFDQMGVELGKKLAKTIEDNITTKNISTHDSSTYNLINRYMQNDITK